MRRYKRLFAFIICMLVLSLTLSACTTNQYARRISTPNNEINKDLTGTNRGNNVGLGNNNLTRRNDLWGNVDYNKRISASSEKADLSYGKIKVPSVIIRSGPGTDFSKIGTVTSNQKLNVYGKAGNWYIVQVPALKISDV